MAARPNPLPRPLACCVMVAWWRSRPKPCMGSEPMPRAIRPWPGIFSAKGRPSNHPLIVHVASGAEGEQALSRFARPLPPLCPETGARLLARPAHLDRRPANPGVATGAAGGARHHRPALPGPSGCAGPSRRLRPNVGGCGLAGPSANRFGRVARPRPRHVHDEFGDALLVLDGGACEVGIESTIVDCSRGAPVLLRPGAHHAPTGRGSVRTGAARRAGGWPRPTPARPERSKRTTRPTPKLRLMDAKSHPTGTRPARPPGPAHIAVWARSHRYKKPLAAQSSQRRMPDDAEAPPRAAIRGASRLRCRRVFKLIWVETPPGDAPPGRACATGCSGLLQPEPCPGRAGLLLDRIEQRPCCRKAEGRLVGPVIARVVRGEGRRCRIGRRLAPLAHKSPGSAGRRPSSRRFAPRAHRSRPSWAPCALRAALSGRRHHRRAVSWHAGSSRTGRSFLHPGRAGC